jgi:TolB-like protein/Tfp pilus assembly protein PilF
MPGSQPEGGSVTDPGKAVFLSYASEDAAAAKRICDALRSAGIEVWFDQSELRGGDVWDQKIRQQIRDCALFVPIISAQTQARPEGYFRREWKLAVNRTHDMAEEKPFLVPVVVDDTKPQEAVVPEQFRGLQWTVIVDGYVSPTFAERVLDLLSAQGVRPGTNTSPPRGGLGQSAPTATPTSAYAAAKRPLPLSPPPGAGPSDEEDPTHSEARETGRRLRWTLVVVSFIALAYFAVDKFWLSDQLALKKTADTTASAKKPAVIPTAANEVPDKSIAVLPFLDMSEKHDQQYFSDGLAEEVLNRLAQIPNLRVIARTSSFSFKEKADDIPTIARQLNVSHVLEGSVRKSGMHLRVTAQLIRAGTGDHLWSQTYDSELRDLFGVQDRIAAAVTDALRLRITSPTVALRATKSPEAQSLLMEANYYSQRINKANLIHAAGLARRAIDLDPEYSDAWARLSVTYTALESYDPSQGFPAKARDAAAHAIQADPNNAFGHSVMAYVLQDVGDMEGMRREIEAQSRDPRPEARYSNARGNYQIASGNWSAAIETYRSALVFDPLSPVLLATLADSYVGAQRLEEAQDAFRRALFVAPDSDGLHGEMALLLLRQGSAERALAEAQLEHNEDAKALALVPIYRALGRIKESDAVVADMEQRLGANQPTTIADAYALAGNKDRAMEWLDRAFKKNDPNLQSIRGDYYLYSLRDVPAYQELLRHLKAPTNLAL